MDINTDKTLVIAGGNSDSQNFFNQIKHKAHSDKRIIFTGFIQGEILEELYSNAYVYVLPSDLEGMPLSLLEAMSYGNCCIISDIPESTEVVENHALIFRKSDTNDLRKKLEYTLSHEEEVNKFKNEALVIKKRGEDGHKLITVRLREDTLSKLDKIAAETIYSRNELINVILSHGVENIIIE